MLLRSQTKWLHPVIDAIRPPPTSPAATEYESLSEYLDSLPLWYQLLLFDFTQEATDVDIWRAFRSRIRLTIATDGSLLPTAGTFGWKLVTPKKQVLFTGFGPIDGPIEIGSSTRSELGGFTGPLLLVTLLVRFWGLRHRYRIIWLADSRIAINRVTLVTRNDYRPTKQPDNHNYLSVIRDLHQELRRPIRTLWVKSHQDEKTPYAHLPFEAQLNVDADTLATHQHTKKKGKPQRSTAHLPTA